MSLGWRIFVVNAAVFAAGTAALAVTPATVSRPITGVESLVLVAGLVTTLLVNLILVRRSLGSLDRLTALMRRVDLLRPEKRIVIGGPPEVRELGAVFNDMLQRLEEERRQSGRDVLWAQEAERKRVAQELHDEVGQALTGILLQLDNLARHAPTALADELREAQEATRASLDDVRAIARRLRPEALDDLGLAPALSALATSFERRTGLVVDRHIAADIPPLDDEAELVIFRVAQESLTNVARHARASRVDLRLEPEGVAVKLRVADDGQGLRSSVAGSGIRGMRERAALVDGTLSVASAGSGLAVTLTVPAKR